MKNVILIMVFASVNIFLFQNFTNMSSEEKQRWGAIEEAEQDNYTDFKSALNNSQKELKEKKQAWADDLKETDVSLDQEVGAIRKINNVRDEE